MKVWIALILSTLTAICALNPINIGTVPNDGTGDTLRDAMIKINSNFNYLTNISYLDVKSFGAVGDGVTDDTTAISNCLSAAAFGQMVHIPKGTYIVNRPLRYHSGVTIRGDGPMSTTIRPGASWNRGNTIDGIFVSRSWDYDLGTPGMVYYQWASQIEDLWIDCNHVASNGICHANSGELAAYRRVVVEQAKQSAMWITGSHATTTVENCMLSESYQGAMRVSTIITYASGVPVTSGGGTLRIYGLSGDKNTNQFFICNVPVTVDVYGLKIEKGCHITNILTHTTEDLSEICPGGQVLSGGWNFHGGAVTVEGSTCALPGNFKQFALIKTDGTRWNQTFVNVEGCQVTGLTNCFTTIQSGIQTHYGQVANGNETDTFRFAYANTNFVFGGATYLHQLLVPASTEYGRIKLGDRGRMVGIDNDNTYFSQNADYIGAWGGWYRPATAAAGYSGFAAAEWQTRSHGSAAAGILPANGVRFKVNPNGLVGIGGDMPVTPNNYSGAYAVIGSGVYRFGDSQVTINIGSGSPENVLAAPVGSLYLRTDGGAGTSMYVKESGTGNTGWVAK